MDPSFDFHSTMSNGRGWSNGTSIRLPFDMVPYIFGLFAYRFDLFSYINEPMSNGRGWSNGLPFDFHSTWFRTYSACLRTDSTCFRTSTNPCRMARGGRMDPLPFDMDSLMYENRS